MNRRSLIPPSSRRPAFVRPPFDPAQDLRGLGDGESVGAGVVGYPIFLSASVTLLAGAQTAPNALALKAPDGLAIEIYAIRFATITTDAVEGTTYQRGNTGNGISVRFDLGDFKITNGPVPLALFGMFEDQYRGGPTLNAQYYEWRLPKPLFVPSGAVLAPTFFNRGISPDPTIVHVAYTARVVAKPSTPKLCIPYACAYIAPGFEANTATKGQSSETDLVNDSSAELIIQRVSSIITTRHKSNASTGVANADHYIDDADYDLVKVKIIDSGGRPISPAFSYLSSMFGRYTWEQLGTRMAPSAYWKLYWENDLTDLTYTYVDAGAGLQTTALEIFFSVGIVGYHEVVRGAIQGSK
jgi:hypothetical protein